MNVVREIERINARELELNVPDTASWHAQYAHSAYIFVAALDFELTEGDVICIFSQFGEVVDCNLVRDRQTGKSRGFAFIAFEDQRSCVLAIDNMNGAKLINRTLRVDHADRYRRPKEDDKKAAAAGRGGEDDEYKQFEEGGEGYDERRKRIWDYERWPPLAATQRQQAVMGGARKADTQMGAANAITSYTASVTASSEDKQAAKIVAMWEERKRRKERQEEEERKKEREASRRAGRDGGRAAFGDQVLDDKQDEQESDRRDKRDQRTENSSGRRERDRDDHRRRRRSRSRSRSRSPADDEHRRSRHRTDRDRR